MEKLLFPNGNIISKVLYGHQHRLRMTSLRMVSRHVMCFCIIVCIGFQKPEIH
jgi:hypothetical protein